MKRLTTILGAALAISAVFAGLAAAASLSLSSNKLAAGNVAVTSCGASSLTATRNVDNTGAVTNVTVSGIPQSCSGQTLYITLKGQTGTSLAGSSAVIGACTGGCTQSFSGFGAVTGSNLYGYAFALKG